MKCYFERYLMGKLVVLLFLLTTAPYVLAQNSVKALSIEQVVCDNVNRTNEIITIYGTILELSYDYEDELDSEKKIVDMTLQHNGYSASLIFYNYLERDLLEIEDEIAISLPLTWVTKMSNSITCGEWLSELVPGENLFLDDFQKIEWDGVTKKLPDEITVADYYRSKLLFNDKPVSLSGTISDIGRSNYFLSSVMITLGSEMGTIFCHYPKTYFENDEQKKEMLRNLQVGQTVTFYGFFLEELGIMTSYKVTDIKGGL